MLSLLFPSSGAMVVGGPATRMPAQASAVRAVEPQMGLSIDMKGKVAFVAGVADSTGYGWAICKALAEAGATVTVGTWPPVLGIFEKSLKSGKFDEDMILSDGSKMEIAGIYPLDAVYDAPEDVPEDVMSNKRYAGLDGFTISEVAKKLEADYGKVDVLVHSLANGPEVTKPLLETSRRGYLAASSASAYSMVSLVQKFAPIMNPGGAVVSLTYVASEKVAPRLEPSARTLPGARSLGSLPAVREPPRHRRSVSTGDPGLRRRHEQCQGAAGERHARARLRGGPQVRHPREHDLRRPAEEPRRERDQREGLEEVVHRGGHRLLHRERAAAEGPQVDRRGRDRGLPRLAALVRRHRHDRVRRQRHARDGHGAGGRRRAGRRELRRSAACAHERGSRYILQVTGSDR